MNMLFYLKNRLRKYIFPSHELSELWINFLPHKKLRILDIGCGSGLFLKLLAGICHRDSLLYGVEVDERLYGTFTTQEGMVINIGSPESIENREFDVCVFNDVLHHIDNKKDFLLIYLEKLTKTKTCWLLIKDMSPDNPLCLFWNRLHDKVVTGRNIHEIAPHKIETMLEYSGETACGRWEVLVRGKRRIFLYDHYYLLFTRSPSIVPHVLTGRRVSA